MFKVVSSSLLFRRELEAPVCGFGALFQALPREGGGGHSLPAATQKMRGPWTRVPPGTFGVDSAPGPRLSVGGGVGTVGPGQRGDRWEGDIHRITFYTF